MVFPVVVLVFDFNEFSEGVLHGHSIVWKYHRNIISLEITQILFSSSSIESQYGNWSLKFLRNIFKIYPHVVSKGMEIFQKFSHVSELWKKSSFFAGLFSRNKAL
jgi:hypothetical protein